jgi:hypothetical protein
MGTKRFLRPARIWWRVFGACSMVFTEWLAFPALGNANEPMIALSAYELQFATQAQGTASAPQAIVVSNVGSASLTIGSIGIAGQNGQQFGETHNCPMAPATLPANAACEIDVIFKPQVSGDLSATLSVSDNASGSPQSVALRGHSGPPVPRILLSPTALSFGSQRVGAASRMQVIVLRNTGSATLNINSAIRIDGSEANEFHFRKVHEACPETSGELAPNASCSIGVVLSPVVAGPKNAQVIIDDDAEGSPHTVALSGSGG